MFHILYSTVPLLIVLDVGDLVPNLASMAIFSSGNTGAVNIMTLP